MAGKGDATDSSIESGAEEDVQSFPLDFSEWTLLDDTEEGNNNSVVINPEDCENDSISDDSFELEPIQESSLDLKQKANIILKESSLTGHEDVSDKLLKRKQKVMHAKEIDSMPFKLLETMIHVQEINSKQEEEFIQAQEINAKSSEREERGIHVPETNSKLMKQDGKMIHGQEINSMPMKKPKIKKDVDEMQKAVVKKPKRIVRRFHRASQTDVKNFLNKRVQCTTKRPSKQGISVGNQYEYEDEKETSNDEEKDNFKLKIGPSSKTVSEEIFKMALEFKASDPMKSLFSSGRFKYGLRVGNLLPSDVDKASFRDTFIKKADGYNLSFTSCESGVLDLLFFDEDKLANALHQIRKTQLGSRYLCLSVNKISDEKDETDKVPIDCLKATIVFDQNFRSSAYLSYSKTPIWNRPKVDEYITAHNVPEGIPVSFLCLIFPDAITIEMDDTNLKFTKTDCRVKLGMNRKNDPDRVKDLFLQVVINDDPIVLTFGITDGKDVPELQEIINMRKQQEELSLAKQKEKESHYTLTAVAKDINVAIENSGRKQVRDNKNIVKSSTIQNISAGNSESLPSHEIASNSCTGNEPELIDLTEEPSSTFIDFNDDLSEISDSSFDSDDAEGAVYSSSEDGNDKSEGKEKSGKHFDRLYEKYVVKKRKKEIDRSKNSEQRISQEKSQVLVGVTKDMLSAKRNNVDKRKARLDRWKADKQVHVNGSYNPSDGYHRSRLEYLSQVMKDASKQRTSDRYTGSDEKAKKTSSQEVRHDVLHFQNGKMIKARSGSGNMPGNTKGRSHDVLHRGNVPINKPQLSSEHSQRGNRLRYNSDQTNRKLSHTINKHASGNDQLREMLINLKSSQEGITKKEADKEANSAIPSFLSECMSRGNRKRELPRSLSPTQRKVFHSDKPYSSSYPISSNKDLPKSSPGPDDDSSNFSQFTDPKSKEQFTISKSLLVKLMSQFVDTDSKPDTGSPQPSESSKTKQPNIDNDYKTRPRGTSSIQSMEKGRKQHRALVTPPLQPPPLPPPVVPSILTSSAPVKGETGYSSLEVFARKLASNLLGTPSEKEAKQSIQDPHGSSASRGEQNMSIPEGVWMAPPPTTVTKPPSSSNLMPSSMSQMPPYIQPPMMAMPPAMLPPYLHSAVHGSISFPPPSFPVAQPPPHPHSGMMPVSGVWQAPPQGPY